MRRSKSISATVVDIPDLMEVICGYRNEKFPFEKIVALTTFSTWLYAPTEPEIVRHVRIVFAGLVIQAIHAGKLGVPPTQRQGKINVISDCAFRTQDAAFALVNRLIRGTFQEAFEADHERGDASHVAAFILRCPPELHPSINKALFFIDAGGFTEDALTPDEAKNGPFTVSPATIKQAWASCAASTPFSLAAFRLEIPSITKLAPDDEESILEARNLLDEAPAAVCRSI